MHLASGTQPPLYRTISLSIHDRRQEREDEKKCEGNTYRRPEQAFLAITPAHTLQRADSRLFPDRLAGRVARRPALFIDFLFRKMVRSWNGHAIVWGGARTYSLQGGALTGL